MRTCFLMICLILSCSAFAQTAPFPPPLSLSSSSNQILDITKEAGLSLRPAEAQDFVNFVYSYPSRPDIELGYTNQALWLRFEIFNPTKETLDRLIYFSSALTGEMELYQKDSNKWIERTGSSVPIRQRSYPARLAAFKLHLEPGQSEVIYIKRLSHHSLATKIFVATRNAFNHEEMNSKAILFFYVGGILCLVVYNLFIGLYARDWNYFLYSAFAAAVAAAALNTQGFFDAYLFPEAAKTASHYLMAFSSAAVFTSLAFASRFLNFSQNLPKALIGVRILGAISVITFIEGLHPFGNSLVFFGFVIDFTIMILLVFLITCCWVIYRRGYQLAQFFLFSWVSLVIGVVGWFGMTYGFFHNTLYTTHALMLGNMGEMLILSLGLAFKISILDQEKRLAQSQAKDKERYHRLVKVLSHDVANAITIFSSYLHRLNRSLKGSEDKQTVHKLDAVVENMIEMLASVRGEEAFHSFKLSVSLRPVDICEVVREVLSFYEEPISQKNLKLNLNLPISSFVLADKTALTNQVISNLVSNAVKFSHPDSMISISLLTDAETVHLKIQDQGVGILEEDIGRIFFSKEVTSRRGTMKEVGTGIGTSLVKDYMDIFKGRIEVESVHESLSKSSGTTVTLCFPRLDKKV